MQIKKTPSYDKKKLEELLSEYYEQTKSKLISPKLMFDLESEKIAENGGLITAREKNGLFRGILTYETISPESKQELAEEIERMVIGHTIYAEETNPENYGLKEFERYSYSGPLMYLYEMESFKKGTGTALLEFIKKQISLEGIFLRPLLFNSVNQFYLKNGFVQSPVYLLKNKVNTMLWLNPNTTKSN